jgi:hypothetical protein
LLLCLLPLGYMGVYLFAELRDPSWRLLAGIGLALLTRLIVASIPEGGPMVWLGRSFLPAAIGVGLWWRGGALAVAELTPAEVRVEFSVLAVCLVCVLSLVRPFLLADPVLLGGSVGLFVVGGLVGSTLSRQAGAEVASPRSSALLGAVTSLVPAGLAVVLVGALRPELLRTMWFLLARAIELVLTPIGWFLAWLSSMMPRVAPGALPTPVPPPILPPIDPGALADAQEHMAWLSALVIGTLLIAAAAAALLVARMLLQNVIGDPRAREIDNSMPDALESERSGAPTDEAADLLGWVIRWLRDRLYRRAQARRAARPADARLDAWAAYQRLLDWAEQRGLTRRPSETTGELSTRLQTNVPEAAQAVDLVTRTFEWQRYGAVEPQRDQLRLVHAALTELVDRNESSQAQQ